MTFPSAPPPTSPTGEEITDYYSALGPLLRMAWGDNLHFGYWDGPQDRSSPEEATDRFTDLLADRLGVGPGQRVLDAGCGVGRPALRVASRTGARVLGVTISREQVGQAVELAREAEMGERVRFEYGDVTRLPHEAGSFDAVLAFESIVHMDRPVALREMARVLRPGGRIVLTDTFPLGDGTDGAGDSGDVASFGRFEAYPGLMADAGLELEELTDVTDHTKFTFMRVIDGILRCRREFEREHGVSVEEVLGSLEPAHPGTATQSGGEAVGCLVAAARKPVAA
ncbi:27-O-demethylrifamycin SV methyltransferase [Streptomyces albiaxialis]|uniref:27-O-demethylrifamycin SV methyltransferase n=1 Tax=Streptomyces albiaxialis TaxID=329523 RepID=A0ABN2WUA0_9ACTN